MGFNEDLALITYLAWSVLMGIGAAWFVFRIDKRKQKRAR